MTATQFNQFPHGALTRLRSGDGNAEQRNDDAYKISLFVQRANAIQYKLFNLEDEVQRLRHENEFMLRELFSRLDIDPDALDLDTSP